ncbi:hypothetical protein SAMN04488513_101698 [Pseudozobellia thermophila]|uniref:Alpha-L-rhamnosidase n=1 Tax=Pseudozobellia thermophila TaxID=192903 RepID=A0A1M6CA78_9FLAO|nr:hypothetical protein SAMN04488513_101698 [Pseudozobellia thermophila]
MSASFVQSIVFAVVVLCSHHASFAQYQTDDPWPQTTNITKPWTRWWWMGNAVDGAGIEKALVSMGKAGLGGVEIQPIYGVKGEEANYLDYLSEEWLLALDKTIALADSLGMQVDMTLGTGWPYGGPQVTQEYAATKLVVDTLRLEKGTKIERRLHPSNKKDRPQAELKYVLAYDASGTFKNLTPLVENSFLKWKAKKSDHTLYILYIGKTGQQVKRAAPGGQGPTVDHYSKEAFDNYVKPFDQAFESHGQKIRSIFNDSYEVYHTDLTPDFFEAFEKLRGYDLAPYVHLLFDKDKNPKGNRIRSDYRETLSDLLLTQFDEPWTAWANNKGFKTRLQAHGSPGNLIDMYASADIPECETFGSMPYDIKGFRREHEDIRQGDADPVMLKFSSSAAHISGKPLTSSETFTWLRDHFKTALSQCKPEAEDLLLNGVNHIFLHGSTYSPAHAEWPGWKFYASVNFNANNTIWEDAPALFSYITRCQSMLQTGQPDNETLIYWPIYDVWDDYLKGTLFFQFKIHSLDEWLLNTPFYRTTQKLMSQGISTDFISDRFIEKAEVVDNKIVLPGGSYKSLVVPKCDNMPLSTLKKLIALKQEGASVIFEGLPKSVPGFYRYKTRNEELTKLVSNIPETKETQNLLHDLQDADVQAETLVETGLKFIRRRIGKEKIYYLVNHTAKHIDSYIPITHTTEGVTLLDPLDGNYGKAKIKRESNRTMVKVSIPSGGALFLKTGANEGLQDWPYFRPMDIEYPIEGDWKLSFLKGGPKLPEAATVRQFGSWTALSEAAEYFSGTGSYEITFDNPSEEITNWQLQLGDVRESAKIFVNEKYIGTVWSAPFNLNIGSLKKGKNKLRIEVTNLPANRIRAKELRGEEWKIFHEINMVNKDYEKFDATKWRPMPSGLLQTPTLVPLKLEQNN